MTATTALARFTADDLARAPALLDAVLGELIATGARTSRGRPPEESPVAAALAAALTAHGRRLLADYHASLARRIGEAGRPSSTGAAPVARAVAQTLPDDELAGLSLLDEAAVTADVETARLGDAISAVADHELRELQALLAALAGDPQVFCNRLALDPQAHARALWDAAQLLPDGPEQAVVLMRSAAQPLATALRRHWAAASTRLEDAGIVAAAYRTVVLHTALRTDLGALTTPAEPTAVTPDASAAAVARIFDALQADRRIEPDFRPAIGRLREPALKAAAIDPALAAADDHPLWALVDRIAWQGRSLPPPPQRERVRTMQVVNGLVDALAREPRPDADRFRWALDRLLGLERNRLERRIRQHAPQIASLTAVERQVAAPELSPLVTDPMLAPAADLTQLPTVPADLVDAIAEGPAADAADAVWLDDLAIGEPIRLQVDGRWVLAQLLWRSPRGRLMLWASCTGEEAWPVHRTALHRLVLAGLAASAAPDALVGTIARPAPEPDSGRVCTT